MKINRRILLGAGGVGLLGGFAFLGGRPIAAREGDFEVKLTDAEWRKRLTPQQYAVLRKESTERAGSSPLDREKRKGVFVCAGCGLPLYSSAAKYDSGTGWPSFWKPLPNAVGTKADNTLFFKRTEVHCRRCGGHLGHVFDDGPKPTGLRYCMNGVAMKFRPA
ncbi:MAG TPA: peptide-methionine (R)-S-oxide reductase MsrB [Allosphingosinicella sp.]|nr:peptide-methionine (R)-S-oxide reductase MsrB [Allosphingosinicella sp.]